MAGTSSCKASLASGACSASGCRLTAAATCKARFRRSDLTPNPSPLGLDLTSVKPLTVVKSLGCARPGLDTCAGARSASIPGQVQGEPNYGEGLPFRELFPQPACQANPSLFRTGTNDGGGSCTVSPEITTARSLLPAP